MNHSGISRCLLEFADSLIGHKTGGLAQVNVALSALMGGVSGSANADAAMQAKILGPEMKSGVQPALHRSHTSSIILLPARSFHRALT